MGMSLTVVSGKSLDAMMQVLQGGRDTDLPSNTFNVKGKEYFYEVDREDQPDGGVRGDMIGGGRNVGKFKIDGGGKILAFPGATPKQIAEAEALAKSPAYRPSRAARI